MNPTSTNTLGPLNPLSTAKLAPCIPLLFNPIASAKELFENGVITGGMIPKLKNCLEAVQNDVKRVHILDGRLEHSLLIEIFTKKGVGTMIKK